MAEKLGIPQITYVEELIKLDGKTIVARRNVGNGWQEVKGKLPVLVTVTGEANEPRVAAAKKLMKYKKARSIAEIDAESDGGAGEGCKALQMDGLLIKQWDLDYLSADLNWCGRDGSPTKVHRIQSVVLAAKESKEIEPTRESISQMVHELIEDHTIG